MRSHALVVGLAALFATGGLVLAQATPTPVDSNIAVSSYAQSRGETFVNGTPTPCANRGAEGCGGCYPVKRNAAVLDLLPEVNPEWQPIGPMISGGSDPSLPPESQPVTIHGTVALSKVNIGGDFPGSHQGDDQNTFIHLDGADNGFLGTGNQSVVECGPPPGENCNLIEMELESKKYPLFAWAGEGDRITAEGRWIFDCGHPDPDPVGGCSNNPSTPCLIDKDCGGNHCDNPAPTFNYRSELHPPHAIAVFRNKSNGKTPATQADVYISADGGGAGDICTVTHLGSATDVLFNKSCFLNHCSVTTGRSCATDEDCASGDECLIFDAAKGGPVANINASDFEFDMPLPTPPSDSATLQIKKQSFQPPGGIMPEPLFTPPTPPLGPTPSLHVVVPMSVAVSGKMPNVFAERITAYWKEDTTELTHVQINFLNLRINNPLKAGKPVLDRVCTNPAGGLSTTPCATNTDCTAGLCTDAGTACYSDQDCTSKTDFCSGQSVCVGGVVPGWQLFGEVNGDWIEFSGLASIGTAAPFAVPPYTVPSPTPLVISLENLTFDEYVPSTGTIHIATTGYSLGCNDANLYGKNLKDTLSIYGLNLGSACLGETDPDPGRLDVTHTGPNFTAAPPGVSCIPPAAGGPTICAATSGLGNGGTCSITTSRLCLVDIDCPSGACSHNGAACRGNEDCGAGHTCIGAETCNATCSADSGNAGASCHTDADCTNNGTCSFGGAFSLQYSVCSGDCTSTPSPTPAITGGDSDGCAMAANRRTAAVGYLLGLLAVMVLLVGRHRRRIGASTRRGA